MANDQLEIIAPNGEIKFFDLNPGRGITNIGRHPENDLVIDSDDVAQFHAVLDHRQKPYQLVVVSQETETVIEGQRVQPNVPHALHTWDTIQLNGHSLVLIEGDGGMSGGRGRAESAAPTLALAAATVAAGAAGAAGAGTAVKPAASGGLVHPRLSTPPAERADEFVVTTITEHEWIIDVEGVANTQLTVANGGDLVATFQVHVEGIDPTWVTIEPVSVNLFEGERATFSISITPPRQPSSRAGTYYLSLITASPDYANRSSAHTGTLVLNPYYDYSLSDLSPKQQNVTFNRQTARTALAIANRGNSDCVYRLDAEDDERGCHFEFQVPGDDGALLGHAEVRLAPDTAVTVPMRATPNKRRFLGVGKHHYLYTITATPLSGAQSPRARQGQLSAAPLVGPWFIILMVILLALLIAWIFRPHINYFGTDTNGLREDTAPIQLEAGETVSLHWSASPWTRLTIESNLALDPDAGPVPGPISDKTFAPIDDVIYTLRGENLLTSLLPTVFRDQKTVTVKVRGVEPGIIFTGTVSSGFVSFDARTNTVTILQGGSVVLSWNIVRTDDLFLLTNGAAQSIAPEQYIGSLTVAPETDTVYQLRAINHYNLPDGKISSPITVKVIPPPTPTPPVPVIQQFNVQPLVITEGESIQLEWVVTGVTEVTIVGIDGVVFAPTGSYEFSPPAVGTYSFVLTAQWAGEPKTLQQVVTVQAAPSPTPEPLAPKIDFFTITPDEVVEGSTAASEVTLAWSVSGATTNVEISGPDFGTVSNLNKQGSITVAVEKPTLFVLTAFNGDELSTSATVQINVIPPTPTPTPPPTSTPAPTPLPVPIVIFSATGDPDHNEPADSVIAITGSDVPTNTRRYQVVAGTFVKFSWNATNAVKTIFEGEDKAPVDSVVVQINVGDTLLFSAINAQNYQTDLFIQLVTTPRPAPPVPFNVIGTFDEGAGTVALRWDYSNQAVSSIDHFKVYRAILPDITFTPYADNIPKTIPYQWVDPAATCDMAYYVVAVYTEIGGGTRETGPSTNSWYSPACPTPTPEP